MPLVLVATGAGCRVFSGDGGDTVELPGRFVWAIARDIEGGCLAIVDGKEICAVALAANGRALRPPMWHWHRSHPLTGKSSRDRWKGP